MLSRALDVDRFLADKPLALTVSGLEELRAHILARMAVFDAGPRDFLENYAAELRAAAQQAARPRNATAVGIIPIRGTISQHARGDLSSLMFGGATTEDISASFREFMADDSIGKIVVDIDSPGGSTFGVAELANEIYRARGKKPIVAVANSLAASAAYWIGASADEFYVTPGGMVGSIGVVAIHQDVSKASEEAGVKTTLISAGKHKTLGNQFEPLGDEHRSRIQARVDESYAAFVAGVARGRGVSESAVRNGYGEGDVLMAKPAKAAGMVDGIYTLEQAIARPVAKGQPVADEPAAESIDVEVQAIADEDGLKRLAFIRWREIEERAAVQAAHHGRDR